jgi:hypothetical protein
MEQNYKHVRDREKTIYTLAIEQDYTYVDGANYVHVRNRARLYTIYTPAPGRRDEGLHVNIDTEEPPKGHSS